MAFSTEQLADFARVARNSQPWSDLLSSPETAQVTPHDTNHLPFVSRRIRATGAGNITFFSLAGESTVAAFAANETRAIMAYRIMATGTTATGIEIEK